jgi:hypothetical protein
LLNQKSEYFDIFKRFKIMVEKESGKYIKVLRSYIGGEYMIIDSWIFPSLMESRDSLLLIILHRKME